MNNYSVKSWMSLLPDSTLLYSVNLPGTHDSSTKFISASLISRCQSLSPKEQLECGARFLDIRLAPSGNSFKTVHSVCDCRESRFGGELFFDTIFKDIRTFLSDNPTETVVMLIAKDNGKASSDEMSKTFLHLYIEPYPELWFCENRAPLLGECRGKIVLLSRLSADTMLGADLTSWPYMGDKHTDAPLTMTVFDTVSATVQDRYMHSKKNKWSNVIRPMLDNAEPFCGKFTVNFLSTAGGCLMPCVNSRYINKRLLAYNFDKSKYYGWIISDFTNEALCRKIIDTNF